MNNTNELMKNVQVKDNAIIRVSEREVLQIEPWGNNAIRVRATPNSTIEDYEWSALSDKFDIDDSQCSVVVESNKAIVKNGRITCEVLSSGKLKFLNADGKVILEEYERNRVGKSSQEFQSALNINPRTFKAILGTDNYGLEVKFESNHGEKIFGMGQYQQSNLNLKGCMLELAQRNSQTSIPFAISDRGYGFLWNNPAIGKVVFGENLTEWSAKSTKQMDYWITVDDTPASIIENYTDLVGRAPRIPEYALGLWQSKLRYSTQDELLGVAREYKRKNIPLSVIVCDFFHWPYMGDWKFDEEYWPDPKAMVDELKSMGVELMVSIWPTVEEKSESFEDMHEQRLLVRTELGSRFTQLFNANFIDATNAETREYVWNKLKKNYYDYGIKTFWLDEAEPEYFEYAFEQYRYRMGTNLEVGNIYPKCFSQMVFDGLKKEKQDEIITLVRCAWVGSQKYGSLMWSGDIDSSFRSMRNQLSAGLNVGMTGMPWWTTDIGGFHGGHIEDESFRECLVRWFEFGAFCPVFRMHGDREPHKKPLGTTKGAAVASGADNEVWSYGEKVEDICKKYILLREKLREYISNQMQIASTNGSPVMRPLFYDFHDDTKCWNIDDEYMFGSEILVAPILHEGMREREVYLPEGTWIHLDTKEEYKGTQSYTVQAPIESMPVFILKNNDINLIDQYNL